MFTPTLSRSPVSHRHTEGTKPRTTRFRSLRVITTAFAALLAALLFGGCASTGAPTANGGTHVGTVEVVGRERASDNAFAGTLREAVIREAALYGNAGQPVTLRIALTHLHFKNPLQTLVIGDNNYAYGRVAVVDSATGQQISTFEVKVDDRRGATAGSVAMGVLRMADPVGVMNVVNAASINRSSAAAAMSENFATATLRHTYGDARAKTVANERKAAARAR
jgi:hypothetical protein